MKNTFIILFTLFMHSCSNPHERANDETSNIFEGIWSLTEIEGIRCFACPKVKFANNLIGEFIEPSKKSLRFEYSYDESKISFSILEGDEIDFFSSEKVFYHKLNEEDGVLLLELSSLRKSNKYILAKKK